MRQEILIVTTPTVPGYKIKRVLGMVHGLVVRTRGLGGRLAAGLRSLVGGRVEAYTSELRKAKEEVLEQLRQEAARIGANAIVGVDFETTSLAADLIVVSAHGTAVVVEPEL